MKKLFLLTFLLCSIGLSAQNERFKKGGNTADKPAEQNEEQEKPKKVEPSKKARWTDQLIFGGGAGASFGNNTNIFLAPQVGYQVRKDLVVGAGYMYNYARWRTLWGNGAARSVDYENTIHGPNFFANYSPLESLFLGAQFEILNHDAYLYNINTLDFEVENRWTNALFVQAGFRQKVGNKGMALLGIRYNLLHDQYSPYSNSWAPIFLIYF
jgi:hypothetical protein